MSTVRRVCRNVKRWRSASMALRWTAAAMQEAGAYRTFPPIGISSRLQSSRLPYPAIRIDRHRRGRPHGRPACLARLGAGADLRTLDPTAENDLARFVADGWATTTVVATAGNAQD